MLYLRCPSCGTKLANHELEYEEKLKQICNNPNLSDKQEREAKEKLVNSFGLKRYCCKTRLMSYVDVIKIIK